MTKAETEKELVGICEDIEKFAAGLVKIDPMYTDYFLCTLQDWGLDAEQEEAVVRWASDKFALQNGDGLGCLHYYPIMLWAVYIYLNPTYQTLYDDEQTV